MKKIQTATTIMRSSTKPERVSISIMIDHDDGEASFGTINSGMFTVRMGDEHGVAERMRLLAKDLEAAGLRVVLTEVH